MTWISLTIPAYGKPKSFHLDTNLVPIHTIEHYILTLFSTADNGQAPPPTYTGPACPSSNCGTCYRVDNLGPYDSYTNDTVYGSVVVEIVDACPAGHALNYCKTDVPRDERCGSNRTNSLDIDVHAYNKLTNGVDWSVGQPNLRINITLNVPCNGTLKT